MTVPEGPAPTVYHLVGPPGSGKRTVGKELAALTGAALIDNHLINDPVFAVFGADGLRPLPPEVFTYTRQVRTVVMQAARHAPGDVSHIFTHYLADLTSEWQIVQDLRDLAAQRRARYVPVWLDCPRPELERRMTHPARLERLKLRDVSRLNQLLDQHGQLTAPADALILNTADLTPHEAARRIAEHAAQGRP